MSTLPSPYTYVEGSTAVLFGVGLMGQHVAAELLRCVPLKRLVLIDRDATLKVGTGQQSLSDFAASLPNPQGTTIETRNLDVADDEGMARLFAEVKGVNYLVVTTGISPKGLTPPDQLTRADYLGVFTTNTYGPVNIVNSAVRANALAARSRGVILLSTSAEQGSEGRAAASYEISKYGLRGFVHCQAAYYAREHGLILNGVSPSPLKGPMASGNPVSALRFEAVCAATPTGPTTPANISCETLRLLANECNVVGETVTVSGGYTLPQPVYGLLPGQVIAG